MWPAFEVIFEFQNMYFEFDFFKVFMLPCDCIHFSREFLVNFLVQKIPITMQVEKGFSIDSK